MQFKGNFPQSGEIFYIIWKQLQPGKFKPVHKSEAQPKMKGCQQFREALIDTKLLGFRPRQGTEDGGRAEDIAITVQG